ncbi:MAG TPA: Uma2 family endonuclease [Steroidobacteraceae bacterium]|nr:Uma2 family endonuclease [Steroidobacteraceae bacterium]
MNAAVPEDLVRRHRLTVEEYYRMAEVGLLAPDARVELIEGEIIDMAPIGNRHAGMLSQFAELMMTALVGRAQVRVQMPLRLDSLSEPEPDLVLVRRRPDNYKRAHPSPADALLVVEVSESSLRFDMKRKLPLYARHGTPEVWIIDVAAPRIHFFHSPHETGFAHSSSTPQPGLVRLQTLPDVAVNLASLLSDL